MSISVVTLCRDLFLLAQLARYDEGARGQTWEHRIATYLRAAGVTTETLPGGYTFLGRTSLSGLAHQVDGVVGCTDAIVIGEWKAHREGIPKNDLLRFKAVTDDYYFALGSHIPRLPILRIFGGTGRSSAELRRYAATFGIALIDPGLWPSLVLASTSTVWTDDGPSPTDHRRLSDLSRALQVVLRPSSDGSYTIPPLPSRSALDTALRLHDHWSDRMWQQVDQVPGTFEAFLTDPRIAMAAA